MEGENNDELQRDGSGHPSKPRGFFTSRLSTAPLQTRRAKRKAFHLLCRTACVDLMSVWVLLVSWEQGLASKRR